MQGKLITVEGCEGVGKTTQIRLLKERFEREGVEAVFTREPGGAPVAEKIRGLLLDPECNMDSVTELLLYAAARREHAAHKIFPALERGVIVICDRFTDSTRAYQGYARGVDLEMIDRVNAYATAGVKPDLTLFLDADPAEGFSRKGGADSSDRMERENAEFHNKVYRGFKEIARLEPERFIAVDASGTKYETHEKLYGILSRFLGLGK